MLLYILVLYWSKVDSKKRYQKKVEHTYHKWNIPSNLSVKKKRPTVLHISLRSPLWGRAVRRQPETSMEMHNFTLWGFIMHRYTGVASSFVVIRKPAISSHPLITVVHIFRKNKKMHNWPTFFFFFLKIIKINRNRGSQRIVVANIGWSFRQWLNIDRFGCR